MKSRAEQGRRMVTTKKRRGKTTAPALPAGESGEMEPWKSVEADLLNPSVLACFTINALAPDTDVLVLHQVLRQQVEAVQRGDLKRPEAILVAQAHTLDGLFNSLARRAAAHMDKHLDTAETYMKLALRAQSQCRATLETLNEMKNPRPVSFVGQANIAHNQQVNNGPGATTEAPRAGETENEQSKLLEQTDGQRLDTGATGTAGRADPPLEAVGGVDRAANGGGQGKGQPEQL